MPRFAFATESLPPGVLAAQVECPESVTQVISDAAPFPRAAEGMADLLQHWAIPRQAPIRRLDPMDVLRLHGVAGAMSWMVDGDLLRHVKSCGLAAKVEHLYQAVPLLLPLPAGDVARSGEPLFFTDQRDMFDLYPATRPTVTGLQSPSWAFIPWRVGDTHGVTAMWWDVRHPFSAVERGELVEVVQTMATMGADEFSVARG